MESSGKWNQTFNIKSLRKKAVDAQVEINEQNTLLSGAGDDGCRFESKEFHEESFVMVVVLLAKH